MDTNSKSDREFSPDLFEDFDSLPEPENSSTNQEPKSWQGSSLDDIYHNKDIYDWDPPPINPSTEHIVLFELPVPKFGTPIPKRLSEQSCWDKDHVRMPFSSQNLYPMTNTNGITTLEGRWDLIKQAFVLPIDSSYELEKRIFSYNNKYAKSWKFTALHNFFSDVLSEDESDYFFRNIIPKIVNLALQLPELLPSSIPLLKKYKNKSISLTQQQIASLLANAFLCTFPRRNTSKSNSEYASYPDINFNRLFQSQAKGSGDVTFEKLKCICNYFRRVCSKTPEGVVTIQRRFISRSELPQWSKSDKPLSSLKLYIDDSGTIDYNGLGLLQVDFANKYIGGGVLGMGCVQEEIRFLLCPELIVTRLFTEELGPTEALLITGVERYNSSRGYANTFEWTGDYKDNTPRDNFGRIKCYLVAIDALYFSKPSEQYKIENITRELNKAYVGYLSPTPNKAVPAVATGNWGCGAFRGDPYLKSLIQLMACRLAGRDMVYYTFGSPKIRVALYSLFSCFSNNNVNVGSVYQFLRQFAETNLPGQALYSYLIQAYNDKITTSIKPLSHYFTKRRKIIEENKRETPSPVQETILDESIRAAFNDSNEFDEIVESSPDINKSEMSVSSTSQTKQEDSILLSRLQEIERTNATKHTNNDSVSNMEVDRESPMKSSEKMKVKRKISDYFKK